MKLTKHETLERPLPPHVVGNITEIEVVVSVDLSDIIDSGSIDVFNDLIDEKVLEEGFLSDISYTPVGVEGEEILIQVNAKIEGDLFPEEE